MLKTPRRGKIYELLVRRHSLDPLGHFDAESVYMALWAADERMSLSTIRSILREFETHGLIVRQPSSRKRTQYFMATGSMGSVVAPPG